MIQSVKNFAVNWTDGMKISEKHFITHDNFIIDLIRDANSIPLNNHNYGLLPILPPGANENAIFEVLNAATNDVHIVIKHCSAITAAGFRIDIIDHKTSLKSLTREKNDKEINEDYFILISVNPFERIPFGNIDVEETPPRHPFTQFKYNIGLVATHSLGNHQSGGNYLIIGRVNIKDSIASTDNHFIPPCTSIQSHGRLLDYYQFFARSMEMLQQFGVLIIQKAIKANQNSTLATNVKTLCKTLIEHFGNVYFSFRNIIPQKAPIFMIEIFSNLALHLFNNTQTLATHELEEMLNYSFEWSEVAPHTLLNKLSAVAEINYDHNNCGAHLIEIKTLLIDLESIFSKLSQLDYIGQRKENIIINEKNITPQSKAKKGWSLLD